MKTIKKVLAIFMIATMILSMMSFSAFAATTHTMSLSADKTTVKAGDEFVVTLALDTSAGVMGIDYYIAVPTSAFEFEYETSQYYSDEYAMSAPVCTSEDFIDYYTGLRGTKKFGDLFIGCNAVVDGCRLIAGSAAAAKAVSDNNATEDMEIGVFTIKVAEDAVADEYEIYLLKSDAYTTAVTDGDGVVTPVADSVLTITVEADAPTAPTAKELGLFTDATQNFKVTTPVMTSNEYAIEKALGFVSGIYADAAVVTYGTEITCEGFSKVLDIPAVNTYDALEKVKGFVAAVTSIRNDNLNKTFTAKAYADVKVGEETVRVYAEDAATAVYND